MIWNDHSSESNSNECIKKRKTKKKEEYDNERTGTIEFPSYLSDLIKLHNNKTTIRGKQIHDTTRRQKKEIKNNQNLFEKEKK